MQWFNTDRGKAIDEFIDKFCARFPEAAQIAADRGIGNLRIWFDAKYSTAECGCLVGSAALGMRDAYPDKLAKIKENYGETQAAPQILAAQIVAMTPECENTPDELKKMINEFSNVGHWAPEEAIQTSARHQEVRSYIENRIRENLKLGPPTQWQKVWRRTKEILK